MKKPNPKRYEIWFEKANEDLGCAQGNLEMGFFSQVCFLSQQTAEKALKAYLISKRVASGKLRIHALPRLLKECLKFDNSFNSLKNKCQVLNRYYIPTRYPPDAGPLAEFGRKEAEEALGLAKEIASYVERRINFGEKF